MKIAEIRYRKPEETLSLPRWTRFLPIGMKEKYILSHKPYRIEKNGEQLIGILSLTLGEGLTCRWREKAEEMLKALAAEGAGIFVAPYEGEVPTGDMIFANGHVLMPFFAFAAGAEALRRQGKNSAEASFVLVGGETDILKQVLAGMGNDVNHLAFLTDIPNEVQELADTLYEETGLGVEIFSSFNHPLLREADCVIVCGLEQAGYEHILKKGAIWLDIAGNRPVLRRLLQRREDIVAAEGFFFSITGEQKEGRLAEAEVFATNPYFRGYWLEGCPWERAEEIFEALKESGLSLSGFSALGKRVKIAKNQG